MNSVKTANYDELVGKINRAEGIVHIVTAGSRTQVPTLMIDVLLCIELLFVSGLMSGRQTATFQVRYFTIS